MLSWFRARSQRNAVASKLYGSIVTWARAPVLFVRLGVPDTTVGRYEAVVIHLAMVLERLRSDGEDGEGLSRLLVERFVTDLDDAMREMGIGDLAVPRRVKKAAAGLYERAADYRPLLASGDVDALAAALGRHLSGPQSPPTAMMSLAMHIMAEQARLARHPSAALFRGLLPGDEVGSVGEKQA